MHNRSANYTNIHASMMIKFKYPFEPFEACGLWTEVTLFFSIHQDTFGETIVLNVVVMRLAQADTERDHI